VEETAFRSLETQKSPQSFASNSPENYCKKFTREREREFNLRGFGGGGEESKRKLVKE
jgi:hypothetical protein